MKVGLPSSVDWPFVGRVSVLDALLRAAQQPPRTAVVAGAAGVGKTRLLGALRGELEGRGRRVVMVRGSQAAPSVALAPFLTLLPRRGAPLSSQHLLRSVLRQLSADRATVIVDDAHRLDDASASLCAVLAGEPSVPCVIAVRSGEAVPPQVSAVWRDGVAVRVELPMLSRAEVDQVVATALRGRVDRSVLDEVWRLSRGLPLFVHELVVAGVEQQTLRRSNEQGWQLTRALSPTGRLADLVETRLAGVSEQARQLLEIAALHPSIGRLPADSLAGHSEVASLVERGLLVERVGGRRRELAIGHPLYAEALTSMMSERQQLAHRSAVADIIESAGARRRGDAVAVVAARIAAGSGVTLPALVRAITEAIALNDYELAERLATSTAHAGDPHVTMLRARAVAGLGRFDEADDIYERVIASTDDGDEIASVHGARASIAYELRGDAAAASHHLELATEVASSSLGRNSALIAAATASFTSGPALVRRYLDDIDPEHVTPEDRVGYLMLYCGANCFAASFGETLSWFEKLQRAVVTHPPAWMAVERGESMRVTALAHRDPDRAIAVADEYVAQHERSPDALTLHLVSSTYAALVAGRIDLAAGYIGRWQAIAAEASDRMADAYGFAFVGLVAAAQGDWHTAREAADALANALDALQDPLGGLLSALVTHADGHRDAAFEQLHATARELQDRGLLMLVAMVARHVDELGEHGSALEVLDRLLPLTDDEWVAHEWRAAADAARQSDATALAATADSLRAAGYPRDAARTAARAAVIAPTPLERFRLTVIAQEQLAATGGAVCAEVEQLERLVSAREQEIALAAATGLSNADLAAHFGIGRRTVENHLHRALTKLEASRRRLIEVVGPCSLVEGLPADASRADASPKQ